MKLRFFDRYLDAARRLPGDEDGIVVIWVTIMLVAIIGLAGLALDASRYRSLKTQMQAGADALALAGARELDGSTGSITRATNAINNMISNTPQGMGTQPAISAATITFYSSLYDATNPAIGVVTTSSNAAKYVGVTVSPATLDPILVNLPQSTNAMAVAGYDFALCNMPPVFICNPYEQAGDTNETANNRWTTQVNLPANARQLMKLSVNGGAGYGPGHFGFLMPPVTCNGASCLSDWISRNNPPACYRKKSVDLNTGQMQSVFDAFNVRFNIYSPPLAYSSDVQPAWGVRKGTSVCDGTPPTNARVLIPKSSQVSGTFNSGGKNKDTITGVTVPTSLVDGAPIEDTNGYIAPGSTIVSHTATSIQLPKNAVLKDGTSQFTFGGQGSIQAIAFPDDINILQNSSLSVGDGNWDCKDYWAIVHGGTPPTDMGGVCGDGVTVQTTVSRWQVYQYEYLNQSTAGKAIWDVSGPGAPSGTTPGAENGKFCPSNPGVWETSGGGNRRMIYAAVINCIANNSLITGGQTADDIPVAGFGKFFMTRPADVGYQTLVGEMTGAVGLDKNAKNNVQLYR